MREKEETELAMEGARRSVVPPGFRFHPTDEELVDFYLRKKIGRAKFELDHVIPEVDLNKLEPWDLREKCKVDASVHQSTEWYFFSHKDKKYPTGTRTNRATKAGFWKATGRDKAVLSSLSRPHHLAAGQRIGMRKTLVFYKGRAPHGMKTDWIMHEYRLQDANSINYSSKIANEDGWVVCRVFKKKNYEEKSSNTRASSYDHSNSNLSDEEPSPIKSTHSNISKTETLSSHSAMSTFKSPQKSLKQVGEVIDNLLCPTMKVGGVNLALFSCKQELMGDHYYEGLSVNNQPPPPPPFYQLPYLESTDIGVPNYHAINNIVANPSTVVACSSAISCEHQAKRLDFNNQKIHQIPQYINNYEPIHQDLGAIPSPYVGKSIFLNEEDLAHCIEANINSSGHNLPENLQGWSLLQGNTETMVASLANDHLFPHFNSAHISKVQQPIETYPASYEIELWSFPS